MLHGCAKKTPVAAQGSFGDQRAVISRSDLPIVSIDGRPSSGPLYEVSLEPGPHVLIAEYPTLLTLYHCTFEVVLEAGQTYEIIERSDRYPVFLNRLKKGTFFTTRLEKFPPRECMKIKKHDDS
jgi:hypothetical protein